LSSLNKSFLFSKLFQKSNQNKNKIILNEVISTSDEIFQENNKTISEELDLSNINHDEFIKKIFALENKKNKKYDIQKELVDFQLDIYEYFSKKAIYFEKLKTI